MNLKRGFDGFNKQLKSLINYRAVDRFHTTLTEWHAVKLTEIMQLS